MGLSRASFCQFSPRLLHFPLPVAHQNLISKISVCFILKRKKDPHPLSLYFPRRFLSLLHQFAHRRTSRLIQASPFPSLSSPLTLGFSKFCMFHLPTCPFALCFSTFCIFYLHFLHSLNFMLMVSQHLASSTYCFKFYTIPRSKYRVPKY